MDGTSRIDRERIELSEQAEIKREQEWVTNTENASSSCLPSQHSLTPFEKVISKYTTSSEVGDLDFDVLSYLFEVCIDHSNSLETKKELFFSYFPDLSRPTAQCGPAVDDDDLEKEKIIIMRDIVGVALHLNKRKLESNKIEGEQTLIEKKSIGESSMSSCVLSTAHCTQSPTFSDDINEINRIFPHINDELIQYIHEVKFLHNKLESVPFLLDLSADMDGISRIERERIEYISKQAKIKREQEWVTDAEKNRIKSAIFERYGETEMTHAEYVRSVSRNANPDVCDHGKKYRGKSNKKSEKSKGKNGIESRIIKNIQNEKVRYRDGVVATYSGEKMITLKNPKDDYDGGSRGTVKTKGKRGPGFIKT